MMEAPLARLALAIRTGRLIARGFELADSVGYIAGHLTRRYHCTGEVQALFVAGEYRRRGIASELLAWLFRWFRQEGASRICVDVQPDNAAARAFYRRHGAITLNRGWLVFPEV